jgi:hypothetical protein
MATLNRKAVLVLCGAAVLGVFAAALGNASTFNQTTILKFSGAMSLPGVTLEAGEYIFELANPSTSRNVVRVMNRERTKLYAMRLTLPVVRPPSAGRRAAVTLGEARRGTPPPIKEWYPEGHSIGHAFIY